MRQRIGGVGIVFLLVALGVLSWAAGVAPAADAPDAPAVTVQAVFQVEGMTCGGCAAGLERILAGLEGIEEARVSYEEGRAYVELDPEKIQPEQLAAGMSRGGLEARYLPEESGTAAAGHACPRGCTAHDHGAVAGPPCAPGCTEHDLQGTAGRGCPPGCAQHDDGFAADPEGAGRPGCGAPAPGTGGGTAEPLTDEETEKVVAWVVSRLADGGDGPPTISGEQIAEATGVEIPGPERYRLQNAVIARLRDDHPALLSRLTSRSRCAAYGACSLRGNLAGASDDVLEMYEREREEDGRRFENRMLPDFEARDLAGNVVHAADLRGRPAVIVLLAGHCAHSHDSLPILQEAADTWGPQGVRVVGILVNSGSVRDVNEWLPRTDPRYEVWVDNDESIGELLGSHLVPTYFFVTAEGNLVEKLVGFKDKEIVLEKVGDLARSAAGPATAQATAGSGTR